MANETWSQTARGDVLYTQFDVESYVRSARGRIPVDVDAAARTSLDEITAADLAFLWRLDSAGLSETRSILSCWTGNEARITAFVATWSYERMWLGWALKDLLAAHDVPLEPRNRARLQTKLRELWVDRLMPLTVSPLSAVIGEPFTAGHMIRMALQEASLQTAYREVLPRLSGEDAKIVTEIAERRSRFIDFFSLEASARVARSAAERRSARLSLLGWEPLRVAGVPDPDEPRALGNIFLTVGARERLRAAQGPIRDLLVGVGLVPGTDRDGGPPPPPTKGLLSRRSSRGI